MTEGDPRVRGLDVLFHSSMMEPYTFKHDTNVIIDTKGYRVAGQPAQQSCTLCHSPAFGLVHASRIVSREVDPASQTPDTPHNGNARYLPLRPSNTSIELNLLYNSYF